MILGVLGDRDAVDDVAQQVWAAVWTRMGELRDSRRWRPWLYRLTHNAAIDAHRTRVRRRVMIASAPLPPPAENGTPAPPQQLSDAEQRKAVMMAIQALPALYREPFVLRHLLDWSYRQIGQAMDLPVDTVETRLVRARRMLREMLDGKV
jgi:RNA polymerase sigma-70 factor (ECF subfamily)